MTTTTSEDREAVKKMLKLFHGDVKQIEDYTREEAIAEASRLAGLIIRAERALDAVGVPLPDHDEMAECIVWRCQRVAPASDATAAALDEARRRIEALERQAEIDREERADVLAFLDDIVGMSDAMFRVAGGARTTGEAEAMRAALRSARRTIADGAHVGSAAKAAAKKEVA